MRQLLAEISALLAASPALDEESRLDARREARLLAAAVLDCAPGEIGVNADRLLPASQADRVRAAAARRARGEPLAYCAGTAAFRHLVLTVDARVLIPRPETEIVVDEALRLTRDTPGGIAVDVGTGSGAIALALATEGAFDLVIATDVSTDALAVASLNADRVRASAPDACRVELRAGVDLGPVPDIEARVIVSNPPYIAWTEAVGLPRSVRDWEPVTALFASDGGMARYDALLAGARQQLEPGGWLVLEVDARRAGETRDRAHAAGYGEVRLVRDLSGRERVLVARSPGVARHGRQDDMLDPIPQH